MNRRQFLKYMAALGAAAAFPAASHLNRPLRAAGTKPKVLVLGIDGMDMSLVRRYMARGLLPNVKKLVKNGTLTPMQTSTPPQSPVAWSNVITGAPPQMHGIYDFIHRSAKTREPYLSTSDVTPPDRVLHIGDYRIPLSAGETRLLRKGRAFWEPLGEKDIPTTIFKMPANFPCKPAGSVAMVSGMGTPDLRGGYGNYTVVTTAPEKYGKELSSGILIAVEFSGGRADLRLPGPSNTLVEEAPASHVPVTIWRDRQNPVVRIRLQNNELLLKEGEWSRWQEVSFPLLGSLVDVKGICKLLVRQVHPDFHLYISPVNIDPSDPSLPVAYPESYARQLVREVGFFYTQGFPEDTKALSENILSENEYLELAEQVFSERSRLMDFELERFCAKEPGMLFFYFSSLDQNSHMYWRTIDESSPLYRPELAEKYGETILGYYRRFDRIIGRIMDRVDINDPATTLLIMSDHGFGGFNRQVNLNTWLYEKGYLSLETRLNRLAEKDGYFHGVNWKRTGAYNVGINSLYISRKDREPDGIVADGQVKGLLEMLLKDLKGMRDPQTGERAVSGVRVISETEHRLHPDAPDLVVGWNNGFRSSWKSILGGFEEETFSDNMDKWSGDHCMDPVFVPAVLMSNHPITRRAPSLCDIAPTVLQRFGLDPIPEMTGKSLFHNG